MEKRKCKKKRCSTIGDGTKYRLNRTQCNETTVDDGWVVYLSLGWTYFNKFFYQLKDGKTHWKNPRNNSWNNKGNCFLLMQVCILFFIFWGEVGRFFLYHCNTLPTGKTFLTDVRPPKRVVDVACCTKHDSHFRNKSAKQFLSIRTFIWLRKMKAERYGGKRINGHKSVQAEKAVLFVRGKK